MTAMRSKLLVTLGLLPLAGCISFGAKPPPFLMNLTPTQMTAADQSRSAAPGEAVTVYTPSVPAELATMRVPVRNGPTTLTYLVGSQWSDAPAKLFQQMLSSTIAARTGRVVLNPRQATIDPGVRLAGDLDRFGLDAAAMQVEVSYDAIRQNRDGSRVDNRRFTAHVPVSAAEPHAVAAALDRAANQVAVEVADWIGAQQPEVGEAAQPR